MDIRREYVEVNLCFIYKVVIICPYWQRLFFYFCLDLSPYMLLLFLPTPLVGEDLQYLSRDGNEVFCINLRVLLF